MKLLYSMIGLNIKQTGKGKTWGNLNFYRMYCF